MRFWRGDILLIIFGLLTFSFIVFNPLDLPAFDFSQISFATYHGSSGGGGAKPDSEPYDGRDLQLVDREPPPAGDGVTHFTDKDGNVVGWQDNGICSGGCRERDNGGGGGNGGGNDLPTGFHDGNSGTVSQADCKAVGWATDPDNRNASLLVKIYHSNGTYITATTANRFRSDLLAAGVCPGGNCAFDMNIYGLVTPDVSHNIMVKAVDGQTGEQKELNNTRKQIKCSAPPPTPTPTPTPVPPAGNWLKVVGGTIFSGGAISMQVAPPAGQFNSTSLVLSGGAISNFTSSIGWLVPNYSSLNVNPTYDNFIKPLLSKPDSVVRYDGPITLTSLYSLVDLNNQKKAIIIDGDLVIDANFTPTNASTAFIVRDKIFFDPTVTTFNGILLSWGGIDTGVSSSRLTITGMLLSYGHITLSRTSSDANSPAETINYEPRFMLDLIDILGRGSFFWQEVAP